MLQLKLGLTSILSKLLAGANHHHVVWNGWSRVNQCVSGEDPKERQMHASVVVIYAGGLKMRNPNSEFRHLQRWALSLV